MSRTRLISMFSILVIVSLVLLLYSSEAVFSQNLGSYHSHLEKRPPLNLELSLKLYKHTYLDWEPIWVRVSVTNVGQHGGKFYFKGLDALVITDSEGTTYGAKVHIDRTLGEIQPQETVEKEGNILVGYGYGLPLDERLGKVICHLPPGSYTMAYSLYRTGASGGSLLAEAPVDTLEVVKPHGEDSLALNLFLESYNLQMQKKYDQVLERVQEMLDKYPHSAYAPSALFQKVVLYRIGAIPDLDKTIESYHQMLNSYPDSREAVEVLSSLVHYYRTKPDEPGLITCLNDLMKRHPRTAVAEAAQKELEKLEK